MSLKKEDRLFETYWVYYLCDKCGKEVKYSGKILLSNPLLYEHICKCGEVYNLDRHYPTLEFKKI